QERLGATCRCNRTSGRRSTDRINACIEETSRVEGADLMSPSLSVNQLIFIEKMKADSESTMWGFERLLEIPHFTIFFDALENAGLFDAAKNPAPISTEDGQYWTIPHWPALDYLEKCAKE